MWIGGWLDSNQNKLNNKKPSLKQAWASLTNIDTLAKQIWKVISGKVISFTEKKVIANEERLIFNFSGIDSITGLN